MATVGNLNIKIGMNLNEFDTSLRKLNKSLKDTEKEFKGFDRIGKRLQDVGKTLSTAITLPVVALATAAAKTSIDLEDAFAGVRKTVDATEEEFDQLRKGLDNMAKTNPIAIKELYGIGEAAGQLGIKKENILGFTDAMGKLGVATNMSSDQAATALARLANITQMPQDQFDRLGSTVVALGNNLATTESEIAEMGLRLAGAGNQVGMTESDILSFSGSLSSVGIAAEAGGSAFSKAMLKINNEALSGGDNLRLYAKVAGMSADEFAKAWKEDAAKAMVTFIEGLGNVQKQGGNVVPILDELELGETRVRDALMRAAGAGDLFRNSLELGSKAWEDNIALNKEAEERFRTTASQLTLLKNNLSLLAVSFGKLLLPIVNGFIEMATPLINKISEMDEGNRKLVLTIAGVAAAVGPLLLGFGTLMQKIPDIKNAFNLIKVAVSGLGTAMSFLAANPIVAIVGALALLATWAIKTAGGWENAKKEILKTWENLQAGAVGAALSIAKEWNLLKQGIYGIVDSILTAVEPLAKIMPASIKAGFEDLRVGVKEKLADVKENLDSLEDSMAKNAVRMQAAAEAIRGGINGIAEGAKTSGADMAKSFREIEKDSQGMANTIDNSTNLAEVSFEELGNEAASTGDKVKSALETALDALKLKLQIVQAQFDITKTKMGESADEVASLSEQYEIQTNIVGELQAAYDAMTASKREGTEEGNKLLLQLLQEQKAQEDLKQAIDDANDALQRQINMQGWDTKSITSKYMADYIASTGDISVAFGSAVKGFAEGGIIRRPVLMTDIATGRPAGIAGESGPEVITPTGGQNITKIRQPDIHLHVGALVADDYGMKQLERMLSKIRIQENMRLGVETP